MCVYIEVIFPTLQRFLLLYSLRFGSILGLCWTALRLLFCLIFFSSAILEALVGTESLFGGSIVKNKEETEHPYVVYYGLMMLLLTDTIAFVFMIHLAVGLFYFRTYFLEHYLLCRFLTWILEVLVLLVLCLAHKLLIGWYLGILFFVVLESYSFIVVYSYYVRLLAEEKEY